MTEWQPIETAPKDGQTIVAMRDEEGIRNATLIFWDTDDGWCGLTANNELMLIKYPPTHWMPLPQPPNQP